MIYLKPFFVRFILWVLHILAKKVVKMSVKLCN